MVPIHSTAQEKRHRKYCCPAYRSTPLPPTRRKRLPRTSSPVLLPMLPSTLPHPAGSERRLGMVLVTRVQRALAGSLGSRRCRIAAPNARLLPRCCGTRQPFQALRADQLVAQLPAQREGFLMQNPGSLVVPTHERRPRQVIQGIHEASLDPRSRYNLAASSLSAVACSWSPSSKCS